MSRISRTQVMALLMVALAGLLVFDMATSAAPDPFRAPPPLALGSGQASGGAHCSMLPR
jgi:hypothetical protein